MSRCAAREEERSARRSFDLLREQMNGRTLRTSLRSNCGNKEWRLRSLLMVHRLEGSLERQHDCESECDEADEGCGAEGGREALLPECAEMGGRC